MRVYFETLQTFLSLGFEETNFLLTLFFSVLFLNYFSNSSRLVKFVNLIQYCLLILLKLIGM